MSHSPKQQNQLQKLKLQPKKPLTHFPIHHKLTFKHAKNHINSQNTTWVFKTKTTNLDQIGIEDHISPVLYQLNEKIVMREGRSLRVAAVAVLLVVVVVSTAEGKANGV